ncbi:helix-turn-helix domain-containing protein [Flavitalea flava]
MEAVIQELYTSSQMQIRDFVCQCRECGFSREEYREKFSICYTRKGSFLFNVFNDDLHCYTGKFLLNKPRFTHRVKHYHQQPDECTIIYFGSDLFLQLQSQHKKWLNNFFSDPDTHSVLVDATPKTEYLHQRLFGCLTFGNTATLLIESLVMDLLTCLLEENATGTSSPISDRQKSLYLPGIEEAKIYLQQHLDEDISLEHAAIQARMSMYHFNRVFRRIVQLSPHQYLLELRVQHAQQLLKETKENIASIAYLCGFKSPQHFSHAFKAKTGLSPIQFRSIGSTG